MTRRPAVTLIEVLVTMFIMAIGMLALLVLFPLGAMSMGQALKDDRCASTAAMGENVAIAWDVRHNTTFGANGLAYVDPIGMANGLTAQLGGVILRSSTTFAASQQLADRWFSLPDDITFLENGLANTAITGGIVDRGRRYSYAYLLHQSLAPGQLPVQTPPIPYLVHLHVVVYSGRPVGSLTPEATYTATGAAGTNGISLNAWPTTIKRGGWILAFDATGAAYNAYFYRVTNYAQLGATTTVEVEQNLFGNVSHVVVMDDVAEVFDKGTSWLP